MFRLPSIDVAKTKASFQGIFIHSTVIVYRRKKKSFSFNSRLHSPVFGIKNWDKDLGRKQRNERVLSYIRFNWISENQKKKISTFTAARLKKKIELVYKWKVGLTPSSKNDPALLSEQKESKADSLSETSPSLDEANSAGVVSKTFFFAAAGSRKFPSLFTRNIQVKATTTCRNDLPSKKSSCVLLFVSKEFN